VAQVPEPAERDRLHDHPAGEHRDAGAEAAAGLVGRGEDVDRTDQDAGKAERPQRGEGLVVPGRDEDVEQSLRQGQVGDHERRGQPQIHAQRRAQLPAGLPLATGRGQLGVGRGRDRGAEEERYAGQQRGGLVARGPGGREVPGGGVDGVERTEHGQQHLDRAEQGGVAGEAQGGRARHAPHREAGPAAAQGIGQGQRAADGEREQHSRGVAREGEDDDDRRDDSSDRLDRAQRGDRTELVASLQKADRSGQHRDEDSGQASGETEQRAVEAPAHDEGDRGQDHRLEQRSGEPEVHGLLRGVRIGAAGEEAGDRPRQGRERPGAQDEEQALTGGEVGERGRRKQVHRGQRRGVVGDPDRDRDHREQTDTAVPARGRDSTDRRPGDGAGGCGHALFLRCARAAPPGRGSSLRC
jgi:hypothetical protein